MLRADLLYDAGLSLNAVIDIGQVEGAFIMGQVPPMPLTPHQQIRYVRNSALRTSQGFFLTEEVIFSTEGVCRTPGTWEYKPPLALDVPRDFRVEFLKDSPFPGGVKGSKVPHVDESSPRSQASFANLSIRQFF